MREFCRVLRRVFRERGEHRLDGVPEHRTVQLALAPEMVGDRTEVDAGPGRDGTDRGGGVTPFRKELRRGQEQAIASFGLVIHTNIRIILRTIVKEAIESRCLVGTGGGAGEGSCLDVWHARDSPLGWWIGSRGRLEDGLGACWEAVIPIRGAG